MAIINNFITIIIIVVVIVIIIIIIIITTFCKIVLPAVLQCATVNDIKWHICFC